MALHLQRIGAGNALHANANQAYYGLIPANDQVIQMQITNSNHYLFKDVFIVKIGVIILVARMSFFSAVRGRRGLCP